MLGHETRDFSESREVATDCPRARGGLTVPDFCEKHGHPINQFKYWKQKYRKDRPDLRFVPAVTKNEVGLGRGVVDEGLTLEVGEARIRIRPGFDRALLLQAVRALGGDE